VKTELRKTLFMFSLALLSACTTIPVDERDEVRAEVIQAADETIARMVTDDPELQATLDGAIGYLVAQVSTTKLIIVGGGYGFGILNDNADGSRTYINVTRFDLGAGLGAGRYSALVIFHTREALERVKDGSWNSSVAAETVAGTRSGSMVATTGEGYSMRIVSESGAVVAIAARMVNTSINHDLTDTGVSELSFPNTGFNSIDEQGEAAPRIWNHKLPFLAQKVIDKGYDLPLPYGIGLTYADVDQAQLLGELQVGINGLPIIPFEFVGFDNARSQSQSLSLKADAWVLPFMNVFAMLGKVEGTAPMDVLLDGNGMLDHLDISCTGLPPSPLCPILEDRSFTLPITASFEGNTYGIGMVLAGGWNNWFVAVPINWTYADMDGSQTDGVTFTVTPRVGRVINLGRKGNLAVFVGGNYLDVELTVDGFAETPDSLLRFDYIIEQENKDKWNALLGFNWDINKRLSWSAEYDGFVGSRDAFISSLVWRY
jgi:hypothetical protein